MCFHSFDFIKTLVKWRSVLDLISWFTFFRNTGLFLPPHDPRVRDKYTVAPETCSRFDMYSYPCCFLSNYYMSLVLVWLIFSEQLSDPAASSLLSLCTFDLVSLCIFNAFFTGLSASPSAFPVYCVVLFVSGYSHILRTSVFTSI